jgi:HK97 family phage prohead protease
MLHKEVLTDATVTDLGYFEAIAAAYTVDRQNELIVKGAFEDSITAWKHQGRPVPIHWNHQGSAENVIGSVDPQTMVEVDEGLVVEGQLDLETSEVAREAWRSMKAGRIALSFGYVVTSDFKREDGVRELLGVDLYEISLTPSPANPDTRITSMKSARGADDLAGVLNGFFTGRSKASNQSDGSDDFARSVADYLKWPEHRDVRHRMDREVSKLAAELEAKRAKEEKAARPIRIKTFSIE